ncbi:MAG: sensor histidine kinase [Acidimicrobiia bacterium]
MTAAPALAVSDGDFERERTRRMLVARPAGYVAGAALIAVTAKLWDSQAMWWLTALMVLLAATGLLGRTGDRSFWAPIWMAIDITGVTLVVMGSGVSPASGSFLMAGHIAVSFFTLPRRKAWLIAGYTCALLVAAVAARRPVPPELTDTRVLIVEAIIIAAGVVMILVDLDMVSGVLRRVSAHRERDLENERRMSEYRAMVLRSVSHEIRSPLTSISGFAHFLASPDLDAVERVDFADQVAAEVAHLGRIVDDLLAAARLDAGQLSLEIEPMAVGDATRGIVESFRPRGLAVEVVVDPGHVATADRARVGQIVRNLLSNAEKYGGSTALVRSRREGSRIVVAVCDDGPGVPEADRERIFEDFAQVGGASAVTGTGLGLGISRRLAHAMGGDLRCVGAGVGACFELDLPAAQS